MKETTPTRVLHIIGASSLGGVQSFVSSLARDIDATQFALSVCIFDGDGPAVAKLREAGVQVHLIPHARSIAGRWRLFRHMAARRFELVHSSVGSRGTREIARLTGCRRLIQHVHGEPDVWHEQSLSTPERAAQLSRMTDGARLVLTCSEALATQLHNLNPALARRLRVLHNGVRISEFDARDATEHRQAIRAELGIPDDALVVGFIGRIVEQKGIENLIKIAGQVLSARRGVHLLIVGDGLPPLVTKLRQFASNFASGEEPTRAHLVGMRQDIPRWMAAFDLLLVPSAWEAFGIVTVEAMAARRPVAAFATGGIPEIVVHEQTGLLAPPGDDDALARHVLRLVDDASLRDRLGRAGRARAEERFDSRAIARKMEGIYRELRDE